MNPEFLFIIIKMVLGGLIAFFAILLMSKTRDLSWMFLVAGFLLSYVSILYELFLELGVFTNISITVLGIPLITFLCTTIPSLCFIIGLIIKIIKK